MAIPAVNLTYLGQPGSSAAQGQMDANQMSGPQAKIMVGSGTAVLDGTLTAVTVNFIDGVQKLFNAPTVVLSLSSVAAPATIGGVANQAVYTSVGPVGELRVGQSLVISGFANAGNDGTFTINALATSTIQVTNASSVAETNPAGTGSVSIGAHVLGADGTRAVFSPAGVADTGLASIGISEVDTISDTSCILRLTAAGTATQTVSFVVTVYPTS